MDNNEFQDLVIKELKSLNNKFDGLETRFDGLEKEVKSNSEKLEKVSEKLENVAVKLEDLTDEVRENNRNNEIEHQNTRKLINQAFEKISENIGYQDKINKIEKILVSKPRVYSIK